jgi:uncharacterized membrane protein
MTEPDGDVTSNYMQIMRERGWSWDELADDLGRQAQQPALDGGAAPRALERWARGQAAAARLRAEAAAPARPEAAPPPVDPRREPPKRTAVPRRPGRQG